MKKLTKPCKKFWEQFRRLRRGLTQNTNIIHIQNDFEDLYLASVCPTEPILYTYIPYALNIEDLFRREDMGLAL